MTPTQKAIRRDRKVAAEKWHGVISRAAHKVIFRSDTHWTIWVSDTQRLEYYPPSGKLLHSNNIQITKVFTASNLVAIIKREAERAVKYENRQDDVHLIDERDTW